MFVSKSNWNLFQDILYLSGILGLKKNKPADEVIQLLEESIESHFNSLGVSLISMDFGLFRISLPSLFAFFVNVFRVLSYLFLIFQGLPLGSLYFEKLNADFLLEIAKVFLQFAPVEVGLFSPVL